MKLTPKTINSVASIGNLTEETNRTRIMANGVKVYERFLQEQANGNTIIIRRPDGAEREIEIS